MTRTVFLAWQDPERRHWYPIGRLSSNDRRFLFVYTQGVSEAQKTGRFSPLASFPDLHRVYQSEELFPLFTNRLMRPSRPDYPLMLRWLNVQEGNATPLAVLARSGAQKVTDSLEVFPCPERLPDGDYETSFFLHGLSHMPDESALRVERLSVGERLLVMRDLQNPYDKDALALRTSETYPGDMHLVGYCPRFLRGEILKLMNAQGSNPPLVTVEQINPAPAPIQFRALCRVRMRWEPGFEPFSASEYQPLVKADQLPTKAA